MSKPSAKKPRHTWFIHGMTGLEVSDPRHDLDAPLFADATLLSKEHLSQMASEFGPEHVRRSAWPHMAERLDCPVYLAVRQEGCPLADPTEDAAQMRKKHQAMDKLKSKALERATIIAAGLACDFAYRQRMPCVLADDRVARVRKYIRFDTDTGLSGEGAYATGLPLGASPGASPTSLSREQLHRELHGGPVRWLSRALLPTRRPRLLHRDLYQTIRASAGSLSSFLALGVPGPQILGAVTAMEMLVSEGGTGPASFDRIKRRLKALLGPNVAKSKPIDEAFHVRNGYVHRAIAPSGRIGFAWTCCLLAISCLIRYAALSFKCESKEELLNYLDFLHHGDQLEPTWRESQKGAYDTLIKHQRRELPPPV